MKVKAFLFVMVSFSVAMFWGCSSQETLKPEGGGEARGDGGVIHEFMVKETQKNTAPSWPSGMEASWKVGEGSWFKIELPEATDADGDKLTYSAKGLPSFGTFDADKRTLLIRPPYTGKEKQSYTLKAVVSDGKEEAVKELTLHVEPVGWLMLWEGQRTGKPAWRQKTSFVYDKKHDRLIMYGGSNGRSSYKDLWAFKGKGWTQLTPTGQAPENGMFPIMATAEGENYGILVQAFNDDMTKSLLANYRLDLSVDPPKWEKLGTTNYPSSLLASCFVYDKPRKRFLLFGGIDVSSSQVTSGLYELKVNGNKATWTKLSASNSPSGRATPACAVDPENHRLIVFSGNTALSGVKTPDETWSLKLDSPTLTWEQIKGKQPIGRRNAVAGYDPIGKRMFLWSGTPDAQQTLSGIWLLDLSTKTPVWKEIGMKVIGINPGMRSSAAGVYDPVNHRMLIGFGNSRTEVYTDVWALKLAP